MPTMDKRERILRGLRAYFSRERMPRLAMSFVLILTAGAGFFCSRLLMHAGLDVMAVRYLDVSYEEIAEVLDLTVPSVKSLLFRARTDLREKLRKYLGE